MSAQQDRPNSPLHGRAPHGSGEELTTSIVRETPWVAISIAAHAIVIALLGVLYFGKTDKATSDPGIVMKFTAQPEAPEKILEEPPFVRQSTPVADATDVDAYSSDSIDEVDEIPGEPDLDNPTTDSSSRDPGIDRGDKGSTSIGPGVGGWRGVDVGNAGRGKGGLGHGNGTKDRRRRVMTDTTTGGVAAAGLDWLARHQDPKGFWSGDHFSDLCKGAKCEGVGEPSHDVGLTGLALLAFLGAGNSLRDGEYKTVVRNGVKYLQSIQDPQLGCFGTPDGSEGFLYNQGIATLAMCEAANLSKPHPVARNSAQRGVAFIQSARNPYKAWRYAYPPNGTNDTSVTGWMILALESARDGGIEVDPQAFAGGKTWIDEMTDPNTGRTGYIQKGGLPARAPGFSEKWPAEKVESMTAVAMLCRIFLGEDPRKSAELRNAADLLRKRLPVWDVEAGTIDYYYWYYGSYAMYQMGGDDWKAWEARMLDAILKTQERKDGECTKGSWDPQFDPWGHRGGRVYSTAIMTLCVEVYYRYARVVGGR